ncbi:flavin-containing monooxygenase [Microbacterium sp. A93]|uniref:flavin-containing monooxygenase n=1 Tax=Microbacterium sp. A93 TaxID=3450716 RepID=UPI003F440145
MATTDPVLPTTPGPADPHHSFDTLIIGAGQAGLSTAYHLRRRGLDCLIVDAAHRVGDHWRHQYDSLALFTANKFNHLPGLGFPGQPWGFATKDEVAAALEAYARDFDLPVRLDSPVHRLSRTPEGFRTETATGTFLSRTVVLATGPFGQLPRIPEFAWDLDAAILQLHSSQYRRPGQLREGQVLVVGGGHSGCDIALEVAQSGHPTTLAGRDLGQIPVRWDNPLLHLIMPAVMFQHSRIYRRGTRAGQRMREEVLHHGAPRLRVQAQDLDGAGVVRTEDRVTGTRDGAPLLANGRTVPAQTVIWATGFRHDYSWLQLPVLDADGWPREYRGVAEDVPGVFFCGLAFQFSMSSMNFHGVGADAAYIADRIAEQLTDRPAGRRRTRPGIPRATSPGGVPQRAGR